MRLRGMHVRAVSAAFALVAGALGAGCDGLGGGSGSLPITGPGPSADIVAERTLVKAGMPMAFTLEVEGLVPATWEWDFGDGEVDEGEGLSGVSHTFAAEGTYVIEATATDAHANSVSASVTIDVTPPGGAPVLKIESVELTGTVTDGTECDVTVNGVAVELTAGDFSCQDDLDASPEAYDVSAVDQGGNVTTQTIIVTVN